MRAATVVCLQADAALKTLERDKTEDGAGPEGGGRQHRHIAVHPAVQYQALFLWRISADNANYKGKAQVVRETLLQTFRCSLH